MTNFSCGVQTAFSLSTNLPHRRSRPFRKQASLCTFCIEEEHFHSASSSLSSSTAYPRGKASFSRRVFVGDASFAPGLSLDLPSSELAHLRASRASPNSEVTLLNSRGERAEGVLNATLSSAVITGLPTRCASNISVALCLPRRASRADWAVEKLSEVGASSIVFCGATRSQDVATAKQRRERWTRLAAAAAKQSLAEGIADIQVALSVMDVIAARSFSAVLLCSPAGNPLLQVALGVSLKHALIIVGPEGGFTQEEEEEMVLAGAKRVHLGERRLRVETAAVIAASSVLMARGLIRAEQHRRRADMGQCD